MSMVVIEVMDKIKAASRVENTFVIVYKLKTTVFYT